MKWRFANNYSSLHLDRVIRQAPHIFIFKIKVPLWLAQFRHSIAASQQKFKTKEEIYMMTEETKQQNDPVYNVPYQPTSTAYIF